jgi:hypothetical protein
LNVIADGVLSRNPAAVDVISLGRNSALFILDVVCCSGDNKKENKNKKIGKEKKKRRESIGYPVWDSVEVATTNIGRNQVRPQRREDL